MYSNDGKTQLALPRNIHNQGLLASLSLVFPAYQTGMPSSIIRNRTLRTCMFSQSHHPPNFTGTVCTNSNATHPNSEVSFPNSHMETWQKHIPSPSPTNPRNLSDVLGSCVPLPCSLVGLHSEPEHVNFVKPSPGNPLDRANQS